jgi:hypothetical protein
MPTPLLIQAESRTIPLADKSVLQKFFGSICLAMDPYMTCPAKRNQVRQLKTQSLIACPWLDMMGMQCFMGKFRCLAADTAIVITLIDLPNNVFPQPRSIQALPLWAAAIFVVWVACASLPPHAILLTTQMWFFVRSRSAHLFTTGCAMVTTFKRIDSLRSCHVIISTLKIEAARTCRNPKIPQFFIDALRVAPYKFANIIRRQFLNNIFLMEPRRV